MFTTIRKEVLLIIPLYIPVRTYEIEPVVISSFLIYGYASGNGCICLSRLRLHPLQRTESWSFCDPRGIGTEAGREHFRQDIEISSRTGVDCSISSTYVLSDVSPCNILLDDGDFHYIRLKHTKIIIDIFITFVFS